MKIALIGASGNAGSRILSELVSRGHRVPPLRAIRTRSPNLMASQRLKATFMIKRNWLR